jgi:hypothetical protein
LVLREHKIKIVEGPDPTEYATHQIDEEYLKNTIVDVYKKGDSFFDELEAEWTLLRDIKSISSIYRLRKGRRPHSLAKVGSMFVTTNSSLAHASNQFQRAQENGGFVFPACITDVFLGTLVWLQSPARVTSINRRKMIADCYAALQPSKVLMKKYLQEVEKLRTEGRIGNDEYYLLRAHRTSLNLLEEKTLGDPDNFTDKTPEEILEAMKEEFRAEATKKYLEAKEKLEEAERDLEISENGFESLKRQINQRAEGFADVIGWILFVVLCVVFVTGLLIQVIATDIVLPFRLKMALLALTVILGSLNIITGFNVKGFRDKIKQWLTFKLVSFLGG